MAARASRSTVSSIEGDIPRSLKANGATAAIEEAQHDAFAMDRRHGRDAQVELPCLEAHANASVLRASTLGDVELREKLDSRDDRLMKVRRWFWRGRQDAVEAKARRQTTARCLEMNVARGGIVRVANEKIHIADDRRLIREIADVGGEIIGRRFSARELDRAFAAVREALDESIDLVGRPAFSRYPGTIGEPDIVEGAEQGVGRRSDDDRSVLLTPMG